MWPFSRKHRHRFDWDGRTLLKASLLTGVPVQVGSVSVCRCGERREEISPVGMQQLEWGASRESLFDDGPIRRAE